MVPMVFQAKDSSAPKQLLPNKSGSQYQLLPSLSSLHPDAFRRVVTVDFRGKVGNFICTRTLDKQRKEISEAPKVPDMFTQKKCCEERRDKSYPYDEEVNLRGRCGAKDQYREKKRAKCNKSKKTDLGNSSTICRESS